MKTMFRDLLGSIPLLILCLSVLTVLADEGKEMFAKQCASCHTIGGGDTGGPDLKGIGSRRSAAWLERVIFEPEKLTAEKDSAQVELVKKYGYEMPNLGISRDDSRKLVIFLSGDAAPAADQPASKAEAVIATPESIALGRALFTGAKKFSKGGAPCVACHAFHAEGIRGGNLAADLTQLYAGVGEEGMKGVLKALKFPMMNKIYADKPLQDEEIVALVAFAKDASGRKETIASPVYPAAGAGLFVCMIVGLTLYKRRIR